VGCEAETLSILVIDDEYLVRVGIRQTINWEAYNFRIIGEASNGEEGLAIAKTQKPDIIITDIRMPFMDGLEFMEKLREAGLTSKIIVLSGYDEFDYARTALKFGASNYLLKPIENQQLIETVLQVGKAIRQEREKNMEYNRLKKELPLLQKQFLLDLLNGRLTEEEKVNEKISFLQIPLDTQALIIVVLRVDDVHLLIQTRSTKKLKLVMEEINHRFVQEVLDKAGYRGLLLETEAGELVAILELPERTEDQVPRLKEVLKKFLALLAVRQEFDLTVSIGISVPFVGALAMHDAYQEALTSANTKFVPGTNSITYIADEGVQDCHSVIKAALAYIKKNYHQNITVEMAARELLVSPSYLMHLIKEELGKTFVECLTEYRIEKAKDLLKENKYRVYEVCMEVGYQDPKYFSQLFKKVTGLSPSDYAKLG
jgi:two-component system response regulator YesN